jgi:hypothetical protein
MESVGAPATYAQKLAGLKSELAQAQTRGGFATAPHSAGEIEAAIRSLELAHQKNVAAAKAKAEQDQINAAGIRAAAYLDKQVAGLKSVNAALEHQRQVTAEIEALHKANPHDALLQGDVFNAQGHLTKGNAIYDQLIANHKRKAAAARSAGEFGSYQTPSESPHYASAEIAQDGRILSAFQRDAERRVQIADQVNSINEGAARRHAQAMLQIKIQELRTEEAEGQISHAQELSDVQALYQQEYAAQLAAYQKELALAKNKPALEARINAEIEGLQDAHLQRMTAAQESAAQKQAAAYQRMFAPISSAFTTSINGIIQGTQSMQMAVGRSLDSILLKYIDVSIQSTVRWIAEEAQKTMATVTGTATRTAVVSQSATLQKAIQELELLGKMQTEAGKTALTVSGEGARTAAVIAGTQIRTAAQAAARAEGKAAEIASNQGEIMSAAATGAAKAYKALAGIPVIGPALGAVAAVGTFAAIEAYKNMASFDIGAWSVPRDMPAMVHAGETILPRPFADDYRSAVSGRGGDGGGAGSGGDVHLHLHTPDAEGARRFLLDNQDSLVEAIRGALRAGACG